MAPDPGLPGADARPACPPLVVAAIGFDELYLAFNLRTGVGKGNVIIVAKGGTVSGTLTLTQSSISGNVTGGTGAFAGARGTISARNLNAKGTRTAVTIRYHR